MKLNFLDKIAVILTVIGAINWGLIGFFGFNIVDYIFFDFPSIVSSIIYSLIGLSGLYTIFLFSRAKD